MMIRNNSPSIGGASLAFLYSSASLLLLLLITITSSATTTVVTAFTTGGSTFTHRRHSSIHTNYYELPPPPSTLHTLSLSTDDDNDNKESLAEDYTTEELNTMKKLIESIALEPSDASRRNRIERTLREYISEREDGDMDQAARFAVLFDGTLIRMGGEVQDRAREKVMASSEVAGESSSSSDDDGGEDGGEVTPREKSEEEKQLWAFVDMMVQSKSLIRKAMG